MMRVVRPAVSGGAWSQAGRCRQHACVTARARDPLPAVQPMAACSEDGRRPSGTPQICVGAASSPEPPQRGPPGKTAWARAGAGARRAGAWAWEGGGEGCAWLGGGGRGLQMLAGRPRRKGTHGRCQHGMATTTPGGSSMRLQCQLRHDTAALPASTGGRFGSLAHPSPRPTGGQPVPATRAALRTLAGGLAGRPGGCGQARGRPQMDARQAQAQAQARCLGCGCGCGCRGRLSRPARCGPGPADDDRGDHRGC